MALMDIYEEHFEEADFLWLQRLNALNSTPTIWRIWPALKSDCWPIWTAWWWPVRRPSR